MNPARQSSEINMGYRFKYIAIGIITYIVVKYAWKVYQNNQSEK